MLLKFDWLCAGLNCIQCIICMQSNTAVFSESKQDIWLSGHLGTWENLPPPFGRRTFRALIHDDAVNRLLRKQWSADSSLSLDDDNTQ